MIEVTSEAGFFILLFHFFHIFLLASLSILNLIWFVIHALFFFLKFNLPCILWNTWIMVLLFSTDDGNIYLFVL